MQYVKKPGVVEAVRPETIERLRRLWTDGAKLEDCLESSGLTNYTFRKVREAHSFPERTNGRPWSEEELEKFFLLYGEGKNPREIGMELGRTRHMVIGKAHRLGLKFD